MRSLPLRKKQRATPRTLKKPPHFFFARPNPHQKGLTYISSSLYLDSLPVAALPPLRRGCMRARVRKGISRKWWGRRGTRARADNAGAHCTFARRTYTFSNAARATVNSCYRSLLLLLLHCRFRVSLCLSLPLHLCECYRDERVSAILIGGCKSLVRESARRKERERGREELIYIAPPAAGDSSYQRRDFPGVEELEFFSKRSDSCGQ